jgi:hypothetical protein
MKIFKKATALILLSILLGVMVAGCGANANKATSPASSVDPAPSQSTDKETSGSEAIKEGTIEKEGNVILKELAFVYKDQTIAISDIVNDEQLEGILGKAVDKKSHTYTEDDGLNMDPLLGFTEKTYTFSGLEIKTINRAKTEDFHIFNIKISSPDYPTARNIKVGDSLNTLKQAYPEGKLLGDGAPDEEDDYRYEPANYVDVMTFHIKDGKIESILINTLLD